jgi:hypothetical protein
MSGTEAAEAEVGPGHPGTAEVSGRDRAVLRAVAAGRCQLRGGCEPVLVVDGVGCADSAVARRLIAAGLLRPPTALVERACITPAGRAVLGLVPA